MTEPPITQWITGARQGDSASENALWKHYFARVVRLARGRMFALQSSVYDEEDAAVSAMNSVFRGIRNDRFPKLHDRHNLWRLMVTITQRKLRAQHRRESADRRIPPEKRQGQDQIGIEHIICDDPTPDFVAELMDETTDLLDRLNDHTLRRIAILRMDGLTTNELAARLDCTSRTIERKLERIRIIWSMNETD